MTNRLLRQVQAKSITLPEVLKASMQLPRYNSDGVRRFEYVALEERFYVPAQPQSDAKGTAPLYVILRDQYKSNTGPYWENFRSIIKRTGFECDNPPQAKNPKKNDVINLIYNIITLYREDLPTILTDVVTHSDKLETARLLLEVYFHSFIRVITNNSMNERFNMFIEFFLASLLGKLVPEATDLLECDPNTSVSDLGGAVADRALSNLSLLVRLPRSEDETMFQDKIRVWINSCAEILVDIADSINDFVLQKPGEAKERIPIALGFNRLSFINRAVGNSPNFSREQLKDQIEQMIASNQLFTRENMMVLFGKFKLLDDSAPSKAFSALAEGEFSYLQYLHVCVSLSGIIGEIKHHEQLSPQKIFQINQYIFHSLLDVQPGEIPEYARYIADQSAAYYSKYKLNEQDSVIVLPKYSQDQESLIYSQCTISNFPKPMPDSRLTDSKQATFIEAVERLAKRHYCQDSIMELIREYNQSLLSNDESTFSTAEHSTTSSFNDSIQSWIRETSQGLKSSSYYLSLFGKEPAQAEGFRAISLLSTLSGSDEFRLKVAKAIARGRLACSESYFRIPETTGFLYKQLVNIESLDFAPVVLAQTNHSSPQV